jgi:DNA polymerase-4
VATGFGKPGGVFRLTRDNWLEVMGDRPTIELWGVGTKVSRRLAGLGIRTVAELARAEEAPLVAEFGPKMGLWYRQLGRGDGRSVVDDTPWVARGHGRETTFPHDIVEPDRIEQAALELFDQVLADVRAEDRPVVGVGLKVRYAPFTTKTFTRTIAPTADRDEIFAGTMALLATIEPDRPLRLLGVRLEMEMPDDARGDHTPTRSGW